MEKILLRVTGARAEIFRRKLVQSPHTDSATRKVKLPQRLQHPHIQRKSGLKTVSEQQHAIGYLAAYTRQLHQLLSGDFDGQISQPIQLEPAIRNHACR